MDRDANAWIHNNVDKEMAMNEQSKDGLTFLNRKQEVLDFTNHEQEEILMEKEENLALFLI